MKSFFASIHHDEYHDNNHMKHDLLRYDLSKTKKEKTIEENNNYFLMKK